MIRLNATRNALQGTHYPGMLVLDTGDGTCSFHLILQCFQFETCVRLCVYLSVVLLTLGHLFLLIMTFFLVTEDLGIFPFYTNM